MNDDTITVIIDTSVNISPEDAKQFIEEVKSHMRQKYIIINISGLETPILFPENMNHSDVARAIGFGSIDNVVSAGFWNTTTTTDGYVEYHAWGDSYTLQIKSREEDSAILNRFFNSQY